MSTDVILPEQQYERGTAVAVRGSESAGLDASDIIIPRLKIGQKISRVVDDDPALYGAIYVLASRDDTEPAVLAQPGENEGDLSQPVRFYILNDPRKGWSWTTPEKELGRGAEYPDLRLVLGNDPRNVRRTYDYLLTVPAFPTLPVRFLMHGAWGGQAAKQLNTDILLMRSKGLDSREVAFALRGRKTSSPQGGQKRPYVQAIVGKDTVTAKDKAKDMEVVQSHLALGVEGPGVREVEDVEGHGSPAQGRAADAPSLD